MTEPNLISSVILQGREFLIKMGVIDRHLEVLLSDKQSGEEWQCSYDHSYLENLTHKTGNFKQFDVFVAMLKSGLLKTSESISLELLTFEDLDSLRSKKIQGHSRQFSNAHGNNKRYLIVTYTVEFDRIHYPLPLEYCGPPDPAVLQATIRRLEGELAKVKDEKCAKYGNGDSRQVVALQRRIDDLSAENLALRSEIRDLNQIVENAPCRQVKVLQRAIVNLERSIACERKSHHKLVEKLRNDKIRLVRELEEARSGEKSLKSRLDEVLRSKCPRKPERQCALSRSNYSLETLYRRSSPTRTAQSDRNRNDRTRSVSPRLVRSEGWSRNNESPKLRYPKTTKQRSRSSSLSSARNYAANDVFLLETDVGGDERSKFGDKPKRLTKFARGSRSSSVNSSNSSGISEIPLGKESVKSIKAKLRNSKKEFQSLEKRIHALQNVLKGNSKSRKDF